MSDDRASATSPPLFIAVEGLDGAGTTTQCDRLVAWLERLGRPVHRTREPSDGRVGRLIREALREDAEPIDRNALALLFAADRLDHLDREIRPALVRGDVVVTDRYLLSSLAYQGVGGELEWVAEINARADEPDVTIVVDTPVDVCLDRLALRQGPRDIYERREALEAIAAGYAALLERGRKSGDARLRRVDGDRSPGEVEEAIRGIVEGLIRG